MKLFLLTRIRQAPHDIVYDSNYGAVIRANDETHARQIANEHLRGDEGKIWEDPKLSTCDELHQDGCAGVIIVDFLAG